MMIELISGYIDVAEWDTDDRRVETKKFQDFEKKIFPGTDRVPKQLQKVTHIQKPLDRGGSVEVGIKADWGGKSGGNVTGYAKGEVHDNGSYVKAEVEQNKDGTGNGKVSGEYKKER